MSYMQIWLVYYQMYPVLTIFSWSHLLQEFDSQHKQDSDQSSAKTVSRILDKKKTDDSRIPGQKTWKTKLDNCKQNSAQILPRIIHA